jgi:uncharacterized protein
MDPASITLLCLAIALVALLYSSVGHAGASGYIAVMALFGVAQESLRPTALILNIVVAVVASIQFHRAGHFSWPRLWPFAVTSVPFAYLGGTVVLPSHIYRPLLGVILLFSAYRLFVHRQLPADRLRMPPLYPAMLWGALFGLLSGLTGVGGGIFLSPLLLFAGWSDARQASGTVAVFILLNSAAALLGHLTSVQHVPGYTGALVLAALLGGTMGARFGSLSLPAKGICIALAMVLLIAGIKLITV